MTHIAKYLFDAKTVTVDNLLETFVQAIQAVLDDNKRLDKENKLLMWKIIHMKLRAKRTRAKKRRRK